jgi:ATP-dependent helicase/nuclease subunit A
MQRDLMTRLALSPGSRANLFIVGDRKQSIYGFRGADVDVFREMTAALEAEGGESRPLNLNFRSQPPLIDFFNLLFKRIFTAAEDTEAANLKELGFVEHEESEAEREGDDSGPLVELLIDLKPGDQQKGQETPRERDASQIATRIAKVGRRWRRRPSQICVSRYRAPVQIDDRSVDLRSGAASGGHPLI